MQWRLLLKTSVCALAWLTHCAIPAKAVDEEEQRALSAQSPAPAPKPSVGFNSTAGDYKLRWLPYVETEAARIPILITDFERTKRDLSS